MNNNKNKTLIHFICFYFFFIFPAQSGICHSDIHQVREEWGKAIFPMVAGHEIGGVVTAVGSGVTKYKVGDIVGVGCLVDSCRSCRCCQKNEEQFCKVCMSIIYLYICILSYYLDIYSYYHCLFMLRIMGFNIIFEIICNDNIGWRNFHL